MYIILSLNPPKPRILFTSAGISRVTINETVLPADEFMQEIKVTFFFPLTIHQFSSSFVARSTLINCVISTRPFPLRRFYLFLSRSPFFSHQSRSGGSIDQFRSREIALCSPGEWTTRGETRAGRRRVSETSLVSALSFVNARRYLLTYFHSAAPPTVAFRDSNIYNNETNC